MQLFLTLEAPRITLPLAYRHLVQSMLYHALEEYPDYVQTLHSPQPDAGRQYKLYTFSQLQGSYTLQDKQICFRDRVHLEIRSVDDGLILRWMKGMPKGKQLRLGNNLVTVAQCSAENRIITETELCVRTCSPVVVYLTCKDGTTTFFSPEDPSFYTMIHSNAMRKWEKCFDAEPGIFSIRPLNTQFRKQVTMYKTTRVTAWDGSFLLAGTPEMLTMLYNLGLGAKNSQGFGMFST